MWLLLGNSALPAMTISFAGAWSRQGKQSHLTWLPLGEELSKLTGLNRGFVKSQGGSPAPRKALKPFDSPACFTQDPPTFNLSDQVAV